MRKPRWIWGGAAALCVALSGTQQGVGQATDGLTAYKVAGETMAAAYGGWTLVTLTPVQTTGAAVVVRLQSAQAVLPGGPEFTPLSGGTSVTLHDAGGTNETVPMTLVACAPDGALQCGQAVFAHTHPAGCTLSSASDGLQEAINAVAAGGGGTVVVTAAWHGQPSTILSASIPAGVLVRDQRGGTITWYGADAGTVMKLWSLSASAVTAQALEATSFADQFPGVDAGARIHACLLAAQAEAGICDARQLTSSSGVWTENVFAGITQPFVLLLGAARQQLQQAQVIVAPGLVLGSGPATVLEGDGGGALITELYGATEGANYPAQAAPGLRDLELLGIGQANTTGLQLGVATVPVSIAGISRTGGTVTVTTSVPHGLADASWAAITGVADPSLDGEFHPITVTGPSSFSFLQPGSDVSSSGGTVQQQGGAPGALFDGVSVRKFDVGINFGSNAFAIGFHRLVAEANRSADLQADNHAGQYVNWGEQISCVDCFIADSPLLLMVNSPAASPDLNFVNSSFDQGTISLAGTPVVSLTNPHLEGQPAAPFVQINGGTLNITAGQWVSDAAGPTAITALHRQSGVVTVTTAAPGWSSTGPRAVISGVNDPSFDGTFPITATGSQSFTYLQAGPDAASSGGVATLDWPSYVQTSGAPQVNIVGSLVGSFGSHLDEFLAGDGTGTINLHGNVVAPAANLGAWTTGVAPVGIVENPLNHTLAVGPALQVSSLQFSGDTAQTAQTRAVFSVFLPVVTSAATGAQFTPDKPIVVTRMEAYSQSGAAIGCLTPAALTLVQGGNALASLTLTNGGPSWGQVESAAFSASSAISLSLSPAAGCTSPPANVTVIIQYRMQ